MYSRRSSIEERKNKRKAFIFIILTLFTIFGVIFWGLPLVIKFAALITEVNQSSIPVEVDDKTPPPPPRINRLPSATKESSLEVKGNTEAGSKVTIFFNNEKEELIADSSGNFSTKYELENNENYISAISTDASGNESQKSDVQTVIYDTEPPKLEINKPENGASFYGSRERQLIIEGLSEENTKVQINQRQVVVESDGNFTFMTTLQEGENIFTVTAEDEAGNKTETSISVNYYP